jgi:hypothetical protein
MQHATDIRRRLLQRSCTFSTGRCIYIGVKTTLWGVDASGKYDEKAATFSTVAADRADEASRPPGAHQPLQRKTTRRNSARRFATPLTATSPSPFRRPRPRQNPFGSSWSALAAFRAPSACAAQTHSSRSRRAMRAQRRGVGAGEADDRARAEHLIPRTH